MRLQTIPQPELRSGEVLVEIIYCALCRSDLHTFSGNRTEPTPLILGHEIIGRIAAFAPEAPRHDSRGQALEVGSRITWSITVGCGNCTMCKLDLPQKCENLFKYGHTQHSETEALSGGLATHIILRKNTTIFKLPNNLTDQLASLANCSTATAVAVLKAAGQVRERSILIFGAGILGVTASAMARSQAAARIEIVEPNPELHQRALDFGADQVAELHHTEGKFDIVLELSGSPTAAASAINAARIGGTVIFAGTVSPAGTIDLDPEQFVRRWLTLRGVHNYHPLDLGTALDFLSGQAQFFPFQDLIGQIFPLSEVNAAFNQAATCSLQRILIKP